MNTRNVERLQRRTLSVAISLCCAAAWLPCSAALALDTSTGDGSTAAAPSVPAANSAASGSAAAQVDNDASQKKPQNLSTIMVTAQKRAQAAIDVPGSVTSIDSKTLTSGGLDRLTDYAAQIPGVSVSTIAPGQAQITIRGITTGLAQGAPTTSFYIDEAPVGSVNAFGAGSVLTPDIDPADLQRIEVLKGPQGTLYGAGAVGGLVRYVTQAPDFQNTHGSFTLGGDSVEHGGEGGLGRAYVNLPLGNNTMALQASAFNQDEPGYINDVNGRKGVNHSHLKGGRLAYTWMINNNWKLAASAMTQRVHNDDNPTEDVDSKTLQPLYGPRTQNVFIPQPSSTTLNLYNMTITGQMGNFQLVSSTTYQNIYAHTVIDDSPVLETLLGPVLGIPNIGSRIVGAYDTDRWSQELRIDSNAFNDKLQYEFGLYFTHEQDTNTTVGVFPFDTQTLAPIPLPFGIFYGSLGSTYKEYSGFANATYAFTPKFSLQAGVRYAEDHQTYEQNYGGIFVGAEPVVVLGAKEHGDKATYLMTASYAATPTDELYARVATGYRPGGPNAILPATAAPAPRTFAPDSLTSLEAGYKTVLDDGNLSFEAALFETHWKDIQILTNEAGFNFFVNGGTATSKGAEATMVFYPMDHWNIRATGAYTHANITSDAPLAGGVSGDPLPFVPKVTASLSSGYHWPLGNGMEASVGGSFDYIGSRVSDYSLRQPVDAPGYTTLNLNVGIQQNRWRYSLYVKNLADRDGITYLATRNAAPGLNPYEAGLIQPRTIGVQVNYAF